MDKKTLQKLEYNKIIMRLADQAFSPAGKKMCQDLLPFTSFTDIQTAQEETAAALNRMLQYGRLSLQGLTFSEPVLKRLEIGGVLGINELLSLCNLLEIAGQTKAYGRQGQGTASADCLQELFELLSPVSFLTAEIRRCIPEPEVLSDDASPALKTIRRSIRQTNDRIRSTLHTLVNGSLQSYLQDPIVTMRDNRYCLPVKAECKGQVPGMIHDRSSSGSTLFIEPLAMVKLNNALQELFGKEQQEIDKILAALSQKSAEHLDTLRTNYELLTRLDFIFAKGSLALLLNGTKPEFNTDGVISIRQGRHPLLDPKNVVPITISLGKEFTLLVVTGPNTGGKTVSLKTVGLLTLMGQAGLHIPALERSKLAVFSQIFADIGDEQSIEQSLSTFSSHIRNIVTFLQKADKHSLVLFDELGAGTDPTEGAALATAILSFLHKKGVPTMATTHYSELKLYALTTPGVENACCEFDLATLAPTYRLFIGIPGKSNAFAIAQKIGLTEDLLHDAKKRLSRQEQSFEDLLTDLEQRRKELARQQKELFAQKQEVTALQERLASKEQRFQQQRENILQQAREEAAKLLQEAKQVADETIRDLRKAEKLSLSSGSLEQRRERIRTKLKEYTPAPALGTAKKQRKTYQKEDFKLGEAVRVLSMNLKGTVSSLPDSRGNLFVQMGILRSQVNIKDLELLPEESNAVSSQRLQPQKTTSSFGKSLHIRPEINLLGKTVDEAISVLSKYLDDAVLAHFSSVRIVHGKGTGALRKGIHQYLKTVPYVDSYRLGEFGEGDFGVTIVTLK